MIIMNSVAMNHKMSAVDSSLLAVNRSKLMKLAEGIKTKKKPNHKKTINFKKDPGYTNIEHLVFGTYRPKTSPSNALSTVGHNVPPRSQSPTNGCFTGDSECPLDFGGSVQRFPAKSVCEEGKNGCSREVRDSVSTEVIPNDDLNSTSQKYHLSPSALPVVKLIADENGRDHLQSPVSNVLKESQLLKQQTTNGSIGNVPISSSSNNCNLSHGEFNLAFDVDECDFSLSASDNEHYVKDVTSHPQQCGTDSTQTSDKQGIPIIASPNGIGTVTDRLLDASLHSPPVHMLIKGKYVTHEFSADFSSPEVVVSPLDSSILCKETVASSKSIGKARSSFLYRPDCCGSGSSTNEGQLAAIKSPPQVMRKCRIPVHNSLPKSSPSALRSTMKASGHKDPAVKERIPTTNCSFRSSARTAHSKSGPPRSASTCTPTSKTPNSRNQNNSSFSDVVNSTRSAGSKRDHRFSRSPPLVRRSYVESNEPLSCTTPTTLSLSPTANSQDVQRGDFSNLMDDRTNNCYLSVAAPCDNSPSPTKKVSGKGIISHNPLHATVSQQVAIKSLPVRNPSIPQVQRLQGCSPANVGCKGVKKATVNEAHLDKCSNNSAALSASIQTQRKVSVSACNPSRPTLSTKIKITMSSDSESESMKNTTHSRSRSGSRSSLIETQHKSVDGNGSRPSSRASLTGSKIGKNDVVRAGRPRTASGPASVGGEGPALRARSSSASSLAASRRLGSESSLNSSQNSLCGYGTRKSASSSKVMDSTTRHSFHAGSHQRYAYNKDASIMTSKNVLANTKSLIPSIGHTGRGSSSASSKAHVSGKPPLCPSKTTSTAKSLPVKDKSATMTTKPAKKSNVKKPAIGSHKPVGNSIRNKSNVSVGGDDVLTTSEDCSPTDSSEMSIVSMSLEGSSVGIDQFSQNEKTKVVQDGSVPTIESTLKSLEDVVSLISSLENEDDQSAVEAVFPAAESPIASSELASRPNIIGSPSKETRTADEAQDVQTNCDGFLLQIGDCSPTIGEFRVQNELTDCLLATERGGGDSALDTAASYQALLTGVASTICLPSFEDSSSDLDDQRSPVIGQQTFVSDDNRRTSDADRQATVSICLVEEDLRPACHHPTTVNDVLPLLCT